MVLLLKIFTKFYYFGLAVYGSTKPTLRSTPYLCIEQLTCVVYIKHTTVIEI